MKPFQCLIASLLLTIPSASAEDLFGGLLKVRVRVGGKEVLGEPTRESRPEAITSDGLPRGYPPNLAAMSFDERVRELARPRWIPYTLDSDPLGEPRMNRVPGEPWAQSYLDRLEHEAKSNRRNWFVLDPAVARKAEAFQLDLFRRQERVDVVEELLLQARIAYSKSVARLLVPDPYSLLACRERESTALRDRVVRLGKELRVEEEFGDRKGTAIKRKQLADLSQKSVILQTEIETIQTMERLDGDTYRVCQSCRKEGLMNPGAYLMAATVDALGTRSSADNGGWWLRNDGQAPGRFGVVLLALKQQAMLNTDDPEQVARCAAFGRELQGINDLEAHGQLEEMQSRSVKLWQRITGELPAKAAR